MNQSYVTVTLLYIKCNPKNGEKLTHDWHAFPRINLKGSGIKWESITVTVS
jgi:hypothetical protein